MARQPTKEDFLKDVSKHEMAVKLDQGVYRHILFKEPGTSNHWFEVVTTPHRLMISGDMGTWVFSRIEDMFDFFRSKDGSINSGYWAEKLINGTSGGNREAEVYDGDAYKQRLIDNLGNYDLTPDRRALVVDALEQLDFYDEYWIMSQINEFEVDFEDSEVYQSTRDMARYGVTAKKKRDSFTFQDVWEIDMKVYSYHFLWCLYAIVYAINKYDEGKVAA